ncbi:aromatic ring-hydroxylating oxygenase subunit alpha [Sinimarinibacterium thermocellulolyticum]|uniref:Aromatic ring-hydroxylating dioxygenase subunit alpha n=1 Tax=Sinimarinibacterium thermocellulolyticum TaxID=3170016 RepID=A0ABV2ADZ4_9GAMM
MYFSEERNQRLADKLFGHIRAGTTDRLDDVFEYDLAIYRCPDTAAQERVRIFERLPMMAAHSHQLPEPGSFLTLQLNRSYVLVTRNEDGAVSAFLNVCRHRGSRVVTAECGKRRAFPCPYHGWTYGNDGALRSIGFGETFGVAPSPDRGLVRLPAEERHGFVWIVENPAGTIDVKAHLGEGMDQALGEYRLDRWFFYKSHVFDFPQNWKVMMDGLIDGYHVKFLHGKTISPYFFPNMMGIEILGRHALWGNPRRKMQELVDHPPDTIPPLDRYAIIGNLIVPNSVMVMHPHHIEFWTVYQNPDNPDACRVHLRYLTPRNDHDERSHEILAKNWKIATDAILNEDVPVGNTIQASAAMPYVGKVILGRNEVTNQLFHRAYRDFMEAP